MGHKLRTVPRSTKLFVSAVRFCGMWANRGFVRATSVELANTMNGIVVFIWKARAFVFWRMSPVASPELQESRNGSCDKCKVLDKRKDGRRFCKACACPPTKWSELTTKNGREGHNCPLGIHPGSLRLGATPCSGGGCGKKKNAVPDYTI